MNKKGFALSEMLIAVAVMVILTAIAILGVASVSANMNTLEVNDAAKEIYVASQNKFLEFKEYGTFKEITSSKDFVAGEHIETIPSDFDYWREKSGYGSDIYDNYKFGPDGNMYCIYNFIDGQSETIEKYFLPFGSVSEDVLEGDFYIEYNIDTGTVYGVVFLGENKHIPYSELQEVLNNGGRENDETSYTDAKRYRSDYEYGGEDSPIGYYGGGITSELNTIKLEEPEVTLTNDEDLILSVVKNEEYDSKVETELTGKMSGEKATFLIEKDEAGQYTKILDSLLLHNDNNMHFAYQFPDFYPGEDIEIKVTVRPSNEYLAVSKVRTLETNSLFASASDSVEISSIRHLENLDSRISGLSHRLFDKCSSVILSRNISFSGYGIGVENLIFRNYCTETNITTYEGGSDVFGPLSASYYPVSNTSIKSFDGGGHIIYDLYINLSKENNQGLFAKLGSAEIRNLGLVGSGDSNFAFKTPVINAGVNGSINAGSFVGLAGQLSIRNCYSTMTIRNNLLSKSTNIEMNIGGFVGTVEGNLSINNSYISGDADETGVLKNGITVLVPTDESSSASVGGFAGRVDDDDSVIDIQNSYSVKYLSSKFNSDTNSGMLYEGGFIGCIQGSNISVSINENSYVAAPVESNMTAICSLEASNQYARFGGFIGGFVTDDCESNYVKVEGKYVDCFADYCGVPGILVYGHKDYPEIALLGDNDINVRNDYGTPIAVSKLCKNDVSVENTHSISSYYKGKAYSFYDPTGLGHHYGDWQIKEYGSSVSLSAGHGIDEVTYSDEDNFILNYGEVIDLSNLIVTDTEGYEGKDFVIVPNNDGSDGTIVKTNDGKIIYIAGTGETNIVCKATKISAPKLSLTGGGEFVYGYQDVRLVCENKQKYGNAVTISFEYLSGTDEAELECINDEACDLDDYDIWKEKIGIWKKEFYGTRYYQVRASVSDGVFTSKISYSKIREVILSRVRINFNENNTGSLPLDAEITSQKYGYIEYGNSNVYIDETGNKTIDIKFRRTNHTLLGWSASPFNTSVILDRHLKVVRDSDFTNDNIFYPTDTSDIDLYAIWEKCRVVVFFDSGDGWFYD